MLPHHQLSRLRNCPETVRFWPKSTTELSKSCKKETLFQLIKWPTLSMNKVKIIAQWTICLSAQMSLLSLLWVLGLVLDKNPQLLSDLLLFRIQQLFQHQVQHQQDQLPHQLKALHPHLKSLSSLMWKKSMKVTQIQRLQLLWMLRTAKSSHSMWSISWLVSLLCSWSY